ncbi:hypothetical protein BDD21_2673 [Thiocapsa rosea]|uniref:Uncharacterized protein n=1 Tax=Thiocapsa rosea TaxID=69360 RepID=A0A495V7H9_9GAMM|nr:hypothetical protein BDD21_2673 [Thiocapsa rosea]
MTPSSGNRTSAWLGRGSGGSRGWRCGNDAYRTGRGLGSRRITRCLARCACGAVWAGRARIVRRHRARRRSGRTQVRGPDSRWSDGAAVQHHRDEPQGKDRRDQGALRRADQRSASADQKSQAGHHQARPGDHPGGSRRRAAALAGQASPEVPPAGTSVGTARANAVRPGYRHRAAVLRRPQRLPRAVRPRSPPARYRLRPTGWIAIRPRRASASMRCFVTRARTAACHSARLTSLPATRSRA